MNDYKSFFEKFPIIYRTNCPCGFYVPDGWHDLVWNLSESLELMSQQLSSNNLVVEQVKSKFGALRFYISNTAAEANNLITKANDLITEAEKKSYTMCEKCGAEAKQYSIKGWVMTLCEKHLVEH